MCIQYDVVYLYGDFNCHTSTLDDFITSDQFILNNLGIDNEEITHF